MALRRAAHVAWRRVGDETVLIHLRDKKIYVLNPSGGYFWHNLEGTGGADDILGRLSLTESLPENAKNTLEVFLGALSSADLLELDPVPRGSDAPPAPDYPFPGFIPPEVVWEEQLRNFGQSCAFMAGESDLCNLTPTM
jgi:hypothetical protein